MDAFERFLNMSAVARVPYLAQRMWPRHRISDPTRQGGRHGLYNRWELDLMVEARKVRTVPVFSRPPQQSDYSATWADHGETTPLTDGPGLIGRARALVADRLRPHQMSCIWFDVMPHILRMLDPLRYVRARRRASFRNRSMYQPAPRILARRSRWRQRRTGPTPGQPSTRTPAGVQVVPSLSTRSKRRSG